MPGQLPPRELQELGVARLSFGPWSQRHALTALAELVEGTMRGEGLPDGVRPLN